MAYNRFDVSPASTVACVASTKKTVLGVLAASNVVLKLLEMSESFDGSTSSNAPAITEMDQITFATNGPGTNNTSATPAKQDNGRGETIQATAGYNWTTQPTVITQQYPIDLGQYNGLYHYIFPQTAPQLCIGGKGAGISITSPNNVNFNGKLSCEE